MKWLALPVDKFGLGLLDLAPGEFIALERLNNKGHQIFKIRRREPLKMKVWVEPVSDYEARNALVPIVEGGLTP